MTLKTTEKENREEFIENNNEIVPEKSVVSYEDQKLQAQEYQGPKNVLLAKTEQNHIVNQHITIKDVNGLVLGGNVIHINVNGAGTVTPKKAETMPEYYVTPTIKKMSQSSIPLDDEAMDLISVHFGETWKDFARKVKFSDGQIHQFLEDHYIRGIKEVTYNMLLDWQQRVLPTFGKTVIILWKTGNHEIVKLLEEEYWNAKKEMEYDSTKV